MNDSREKKDKNIDISEISSREGTLTLTEETETDEGASKCTKKHKYTFHHAKKGDCFGKNFILKGTETNPYHAKCLAISRYPCHFVIFSRKSFDRINDRIYKKQVQLELSFLKLITQLR